VILEPGLCYDTEVEVWGEAGEKLGKGWGGKERRGKRELGMGTAQLWVGRYLPN
jgi:hypothetical protein